MMDAIFYITSTLLVFMLVPTFLYFCFYMITRAIVDGIFKGLNNTNPKEE